MTEIAEVGLKAKIRKRHRMVREIVEKDPFCKHMPKWAHHCAIGTYLEQGWAAFDQNQNGKSIASGAWGDELYLMSDGSISSKSRHLQRSPYP